MAKLTLTVTVKAHNVAEGYNFALDDKILSPVEMFCTGWRPTLADQEMVYNEAMKYDRNSWMYHQLMIAVNQISNVNLRTIVRCGIPLSESETEKLVQILCKGCRTKKWNRIRSIVTYGLSQIDQAAILERMELNTISGEWHYFGGQCYTSEIAYIRDDIIYSE